MISIIANKLHIKNAGVSTITAKVSGLTFTQVLTVNKARLNIKANDKSKTAGAANPTLDVTYTGFVYKDNATSLITQPVLTTTAVTSSPAGNYPITVSGAAAANYVVTYAPGTLTVNKSGSGMAVHGNGVPVVSQAVSPNGDGINDYLNIDNIELYPDNIFRVMNSRGVQVYTTQRYNNLSNRFEGHSQNGQQLPAGTYFYLLEYNGQTQNGYLILKY